MSENQKDSPITITEKAAEKLLKLIKDKDLTPDKEFLRVFIHGGGCSGFQYGLMLEGSPSENDKIFESNGAKIVIDPISLRYLKGAEVDLSNDLMESFTIKNPNAKSTCGCGQSFQPAN